MISHILSHIDYIDETIEQLSARIEEVVVPFSRKVELLERPDNHCVQEPAHILLIKALDQQPRQCRQIRTRSSYPEDQSHRLRAETATKASTCADARSSHPPTS